MRIGSTAFLRVARRAFTATTAAAVIGGTALLSAGTASAATVTTDSCTSVVGGRVGDTVVLDGAAVSELVRQGAEEARTIVIIHHLTIYLTIWPNHLARKIEDEQLEVGTVPDRRADTISGETIGEAVRAALEGKAGLGALPSTKETTLDTIASRVAQACSLTVEATNYTAPSSSKPSPGAPSGEASDRADRPEGKASGSGRSGDHGPDASLPDGGLQTTGDVMAERRDYGGIPVAEAPGAGISVPEDLRYGPPSGLPGELTSPRYGTLDGDTGNSAQGSGDVRDAGEADALAARDQRQAVQLPMLLAVVALAAVTAGLVRSWVLRRAS